MSASCSRTEIEAALKQSGSSDDELRYPETCRTGPRHPERPLATRFRTASERVHFVDALQGPVSQDVNAEVGDFVVRRRDGFFAYQLAVVVDDAELGITQVIRGADLLDNTPRQRLLQQALGLPAPDYAHLPVAVDAAGAKLSKTTQSQPVDPARAGEVLWQALQFLEQVPPSALFGAPAPELWGWALNHWALSRLRGLKTRLAPLP